jgi:tetratricopeptide (TPR) repeat protein
VRTALALLLGYRAAIESGDIDRADRSLERAERLAAELRQPTLRWMCLWLRGGRLLMAGSLAEAERASAEAARLGEALGQPDTASFRFAFRYQAAFEQGRLAPFEAELRAAWGQLGMPIVDALLALFCCEVGQTDEARHLLHALVTPDSSRIPVDLYWLRATTDCASVAVRLDDEARCGFLYRQLVPYAGQFVAHNAVGTTGSVSHYLGLLASAMGRFDEADRHFAVAAKAHRRVRAPNWLARTERERARIAERR